MKLRSLAVLPLVLLVVFVVPGHGEVLESLASQIKSALRPPEQPIFGVLAEFAPATGRIKFGEDKVEDGSSFFLLDYPFYRQNRWKLYVQPMWSGASSEGPSYLQTGVGAGLKIPELQSTSADLFITYLLPANISANHEYEFRFCASGGKKKLGYVAQPFVTGPTESLRDAKFGWDLDGDYKLSKPWTAGLRSFGKLGREEREVILGPSWNLKMGRMQGYLFGGYDLARTKDNFFSKLSFWIDI